MAVGHLRPAAILHFYNVKKEDIFHLNLYSTVVDPGYPAGGVDPLGGVDL